MAQLERYIFTAKDVFDYVWFLRHLKKEAVRALYLNQDNKLIHSATISMGDDISVSFFAKDVFRIAIVCNASGIILVHNHPSGNSTPSSDDIAITKKLVEIGKITGIDFIDHVIVTSHQYTSILKNT